MSEIQSVIFDKNYYSVSDANAFLKRHNFENSDYYDEKPKTYRFRQFNPIFFKRFRIIKPKNKDGLEFVIGYY